MKCPFYGKEMRFGYLQGYKSGIQRENTRFAVALDV